MIPLIDFEGEPNQRELQDILQTVFDEKRWIGGHWVDEFEEEWANFVGAEACVGVANGTDALEIALQSLQLDRGSKVLVPDFSFVATAEAVINSGLWPVYVPTDKNGLMDMIKVGQILKDRPDDIKAMVVVHLYGAAVSRIEMRTISALFGIEIIEDCAQAHGARYPDTLDRVGSNPDTLCTWSFMPAKILPAIGDAGAITGLERNIKRLRSIGHHARTSHVSHEKGGRNSRMDSIQAAVLVHRLDHLPVWIKDRERIAKQYAEGFEEFDTQFLPEAIPGRVWSYYVIQTNGNTDRHNLGDYLNENGIQTGIHYPYTLTSCLGENATSGWQSRGTQLKESVLTLPMSPWLDHSSQKKVVRIVREFYNTEPTQRDPTSVG